MTLPSSAERMSNPDIARPLSGISLLAYLAVSTGLCLPKRLSPAKPHSFMDKAYFLLIASMIVILPGKPDTVAGTGMVS